MPALCRDCLATFEHAPPRCPHCARTRILSHPELFELSIAHIDCDSFYASVEKRDDPSLSAKPVIVGGGTRGVVTTCCYIARISGVRSAMPMFQARKLCPDAVIIKPRMDHYVAVSRQIRARMAALTPQIEPLSLDEAFLDLTGTTKLHNAPPALQMARLARAIETEVGVSASVGLSHNKFLAKIASDLDKPRGFSVIGRADTETFLHDKPVGILWGVGAATRAALGRAGIRTLADIRRAGQDRLVARFGATGARLFELAHGRDSRQITPDAPIKSISNETTFATDMTERAELLAQLWHMSQKVSARMKAREIAGRTVTLKLKRADFSSLTRQTQLEEPSQLADTLYRAGERLFNALPPAMAYRLIGIGFSDLCAADGRDPVGDLLDPQASKRAGAERAADAIRARFGDTAINTGRGLTAKDKNSG